MVSGGGGVEERVRVRVTQDRYGKDLELGSAYLSRWTEESPDLAGQVAFGRPTGRTGSAVFTIASGRNGEVTSATVVRVRFTAEQQPPQILGVRSIPPLAEEDGWLQLSSVTVTFEVSATPADRAPAGLHADRHRGGLVRPGRGRGPHGHRRPAARLEPSGQ